MARALMYTKRSCCPRIAGTEVLFTTCFANLPSCEVELNRAGELCSQLHFHIIFRDLGINGLQLRNFARRLRLHFHGTVVVVEK
jgi:hypothetical protein